MGEDVDDFQALMKRVREGSPEAIRQVLETYGQHILRVVRRRLSKKMRSEYDSRDFMQDIWADFFAREIRNRNFEGPEDLLNFLAVVAKNKVTDAYHHRQGYTPREEKREKSLDGSAAVEAVMVPDANPTPSQVAMANEKWDDLKNRVNRPARRILELLRQGLTHKEVAHRLGVNEKTVRRVLARLAPDEPSS